MDDKRFDHLVKLIGRGASRRSILKGLFGLGGAAVTGSILTDDSDARGIFTRPTIPPPPPPTTTTTTTTAAPCPPGQVKCPNSTLCCPTGTCGREGTKAVCCASPSLRTTSGECCDSVLQRCDTDCCPDETVCLTRVFPEGPFVEEETCCPVEQTCDERCCEGECFDPGLTVNGGEVFPLQVDPFERLCCPPEDTVCEGSEGTLCCTGTTPQCCVRPDGVAICIVADACCTDDDCPGECGVCYEGQCVDDGEACGECEVCYQGQCISTCEECEFCDGDSCFPCGGEAGGVCCDGICILDSECCDDLHCTELLANVDPGCVICYQGQCVIQGDGTGGPPCDFDGAAGTCCFGECIDANDDCATCMAFGESCFIGPRPCCEGLFCDPLLDFICIRRCEVCDSSGTECVPADDESTCVLDDFTAGTCCGGICVVGDACPTTTTTTAAPTTTTTAAPPTTTTAAPTTTTAAPTTTTAAPTTTTTPSCQGDGDCSHLNNPANCEVGACSFGGCVVNGCSLACCDGSCVECCDDLDCGDSPKCDPSSNVCVDCLVTGDCEALGYSSDCVTCNAGACQAGQNDVECNTFDTNCFDNVCGYCVDGVCALCRDNGQLCTVNAHCCSDLCFVGTCAQQ